MYKYQFQFKSVYIVFFKVLYFKGKIISLYTIKLKIQLCYDFKIVFKININIVTDNIIKNLKGGGGDCPV